MPSKQKLLGYAIRLVPVVVVASILALAIAMGPGAGTPGEQIDRTDRYAQESGVHRAELQAHGWRGTVLDNIGNADHFGNGLNPLCNGAFPGRSIFRNDSVGWNFEHVFNGAAKDASRSRFTPRRDACFVRRHTDASASLYWPGSRSTWGIESEMRYTIVDPRTIDLRFEATLKTTAWPMGYLAMMWASYMDHARDRRIFFYGREGDRDGWISFGEDVDDRFESGTVRHHESPPLVHEAGAEALNIVEHPRKTFTLPFYFGLVDGDGDRATEEDTMAYVVMFDQAEAIRFAMWNFTTTPEGKPDTHSPAWDWQFVIRSPEIGKTYRYRARIRYIPFQGPDAVLQEYEDWRRRLGSAENRNWTPGEPQGATAGLAAGSGSGPSGAAVGTERGTSAAATSPARWR